MADVVSNIAKGRVVELYNRVKSNDPAASGFKWVWILKGSMTDDAFRDADTLAAVLALCTERNASGWARVTQTDADIAALPAPDDVNNRYDIDLPDPSATPTNAAHTVDALVLAYFPDTAGADSTGIPIGKFDLASTIVPDGNPVTAVVNAAGFFRAS